MPIKQEEINPKHAFFVLYTFIVLVNVSPHFFFSLFYLLYYVDAVGDSSDLHCVVDNSSEGRMEHPGPVDYKKYKMSLSQFMDKGPLRYSDVTDEYRGLMLFGFITQLLLLLVGIFQTVRFTPNVSVTDVAKDMVGMCSSCLVGIASLVQIIMTLVARNSRPGKICGGDYIPRGQVSNNMMNYYEQTDGKFLFVVPIVMLCIMPV